jgi:hypothetical protein
MQTEDETGTTIDTEEAEGATKAGSPGDGEQDGTTRDKAGETGGAPESGEGPDAEQREAYGHALAAGETVQGGEDGQEGQEGQDSGVGMGAGAVISAALGLVSLTGGWIGSVASQRSQLMGQLRNQTSGSASVAKQLQAAYGDAWEATALWAGLFALLALIVGAVVLARPAFGAPGRTPATWIRAVTWAGVSLGVLGLLLAVLKYSGAILGLPTVS